MNTTISNILSGVLGLFVGWFWIGPWLTRLFSKQDLERRIQRMKEINREAHPEDRLTDEQIQRIADEMRKYWSIH